MLNVNIYKSTDAGKTWKPISVPHGDNHDMWIASNDSNRMIEANDGGGTVSVNGGETWTPETMPTAQFYHVITTKHVPYHVCGAQQDNSTACVSSQPRRAAPADPAAAPTRCSTRSAAARAATSPAIRATPDIFYAGSYGGLISRLDRRTGQERAINPYPGQPDGLRVGRHRRALPVDVPDRARADRSRDALRRLAARLEVDQRRPELDADQPRPDAPRSEDDGRLGRADHEGQHRRRDLRDGLHDRAVAEATPT